jgi:hypothetical protein
MGVFRVVLDCRAARSVRVIKVHSRVPGTVGHLVGHLRKLLSTYSFSIRDLIHDRLFPGVAMLAEKELATVGRMADGRLFVSLVDLLHAYVHALAIARQVKE